MEMAVLERFSGTVKPQSTLTPVCTGRDVIALQDMVGTVYTSKEVRHYVANIAAMTRTHPSLQLGVSTRGAIALYKAAQVTAAMAGRDYVIPEDVVREAIPVLAHRVTASSGSRMDAENYLLGKISGIVVPLENAETV